MMSTFLKKSMVLLAAVFQLHAMEEGVAPNFMGDPRADMCLAPYNNAIMGGDLWLRPVFATDWEAFLPIYTNPDAMKFYGSGKTFEQELVCNYITSNAHVNFTSAARQQFWSILSYEGVVGEVRVFKPKDEGERLEIGYSLNPAMGGRGFATKASELVTKTVGGPFVATVHPENIASVRVLEKVGFRKDLTRLGVAKYGQIRDYYLLNEQIGEGYEIIPRSQVARLLYIYALCNFSELSGSRGLSQ
jgi:[ribosomal protein S5]-alanine N-acetyltransferase